MARRVFFSFHYEDVKFFRANVVRNSWVVNNNFDTVFFDGSLWEKAQTKGTDAIRNLIDNVGLKNTSVTTVLIGAETHTRRWVRYEILKSFERGNGILGLHVNRIKDRHSRITSRGLNPLDRLGFEISEDGRKISFLELNIGKWQSNRDIPEITNKQSNTLFYPPNFWGNNSDWGKFFRFSDVFPSYCWVNDGGRSYFADWVETAAIKAGR